MLHIEKTLQILLFNILRSCNQGLG